MTLRTSSLLALVLWLAAVATARADDPLDQARQAFAAGDFAAAARAARAVDSADAYALRARAILIDALYGDHDQRRRLQRAAEGHRLATQALALAPDHLEGHLQAAIALGMMAKEAGTFEAMNEDYGSRIKRHLDAALAVAPDNPYALGLLALWHSSVVAKAGDDMARRLFGASLAAATPLFDRLVGDPQCPAIVRLELAHALATLDRPGDQAKADAVIAAVAAVPAATAVDRLAVRLARADLAERTQLAAAAP